ncbi:FlgD immunoglobulin-like domain containing protein, partial [Candidatus Latescibacterota bacterium]
NEVGSLDTSVQPSLLFNITAGASILTDLASTPNLFAVSAGGDGDEFDMVDTYAEVILADDVWLSDSISPQIVSAVTLDGGSVMGVQNGKLDAIQLTFSEAMGSDASTYEDLIVTGAVIDSAVVNGVNVLVRLVEDDYNTGLVPTITYSGDTIKDASGAKLGTIHKVASDNALPVIVKAYTADNGYNAQTANNGKIDGMKIMFSEPMNLAKLASSKDPVNGLIDEFSFLTAGYTVADTVEIVDDQNMIIYITENAAATTGDTGVKPDLAFAALGDSNLVDMNGYFLDTIVSGDVSEKDGASPVAMVVTTLDSNKDGFIDGAEVLFSETPEIDKDDTLLVLAAFTLEEVENEIDLTGATLSKSGDKITFKGVSLGAGSEDWDTGELPGLFIGEDSGITDGDNAVIAIPDSVASTDGAAPIVGKAIAQTLTKNIVITFSEDVIDENGADLAKEDFIYINYADSVATTSISGVASNDDVADNAWSLTTSNTLTDAHVTMDMLTIVAGRVEDTAGIAAIIDTVYISDMEVPTLKSATTLDIDSDGYIDNIKLKFSEEIKDKNISGFKATEDSTIAIPLGFSPKWALEGYEVIGINFSRSKDSASIATDIAGTDVLNVGDVSNDEYLYLAIVEGEVPDTDALPLLSMVGGVGGSGVGDYTPNYVATISGKACSDGAGIAIMSAAMVSPTIMEIVLSEPVNKDDEYKKESTYPLAADVFSWKIGSQRLEWIGEVANMYGIVADGAVAPDVMVLEVPEASKLTPGMISTIALKAGMLEDDSKPDKKGGIANTDTSAIDVTPAAGGEAVSSDLPDAFALSKNFPNPFNPTTTIEYAIPSDGAGHVDMVIYNINGQKVRTLVNETQDAGYYNVVWDGRNDSGEMVSSGLYLYRIVSGSFNKIEKMTFMK